VTWGEAMLRSILRGVLAIVGVVVVFTTAAFSADDDAKSKADERWFIPRYGPLNWYREAGGHDQGGRLPSYGKFRIKQFIGDELEIEIGVPEPASKLGFVLATDGYITKINQELTFTSAMQYAERPPLRFWFNSSSIADFLTKDVGRNVQHDLEENLNAKWASENAALPILDVKTATTQTTQRKVRIARVLLRLPSPAKLAALALSDKRSDKIIFVVDASAAMEPAGREVLLATLARLSARDTKWRNSKSIGSILLRGEGRDKVILHSFKPFDEAVNTLEGVTFDGTVAAQPLIDAIYEAAVSMRGGQNIREGMIVVFASAEVFPAARGEAPFRVPKGMTIGGLIKELTGRRLNLLVVQMAAQSGSNLSRVLADIERLGGPRTITVRYKPEAMERQIITAIEKLLVDEAQSRVMDENMKLIADSIVNLDGVPIFPPDFNFKGMADKIEKFSASAPRAAEWINVPVWVIADQALLSVNLDPRIQLSVVEPSPQLPNRVQPAPSGTVVQPARSTAVPSTCPIGQQLRGSTCQPNSLTSQDFVVHDNRDIDGGDLRSFKNADLQSCKSTCSADLECLAYSFDKWNGWCFLKSATDSLRMEPSSIVGIRQNLPQPPAANVAVLVERFRGKYFPGNGYRTLLSKNLETCEQTCRSDDECVAYTFRNNNNHCKLFNSTGEYFSNNSANSGVKRQAINLDPGIQIGAAEPSPQVPAGVQPTTSGTIVQPVRPTAVPSACPIGQQPRGSMCQPNSLTSQDFVVHDNRDIDGGDLRSFKNADLQSCKSTCTADLQCLAYSFDKWNGWCFLKSAADSLRLEPSSIVGIRQNLSQPPAANVAVLVERFRGKYFPGNGYRTSLSKSFETCEQTCRSDDECVAYTFQRNDSQCKLFETTSEYLNNSFAISGVKRQIIR
jgi:hypothetical protein